MKRTFTGIGLLTGVAAAAIGVAACEGSFAGPPQGSGTLQNGVEPLIGANPFTFEPEMRSMTGFYVDHWFLDPSNDSDDVYARRAVLSDVVNTLSDLGFERFVSTGIASGAGGPRNAEGNVFFPMSVSFVCQYFLRLADNSRPLEYDIYGREVFSSSTLDISIITCPVDPGSGGLFPNGNPILPLYGWGSPASSEPTDYPPPQLPFANKQFSEVGIIRYLSAAATNGFGDQALGIAIGDDVRNSHVETNWTLPKVDAVTKVQVPLDSATGVFGDVYALTYLRAPVKQVPESRPTDSPPYYPSLDDDPDLEAALIEAARHFAAVHANIIGQSVGLSTGASGTIMDQHMATFENGYVYRFASEDFRILSTTALPGQYRDPAERQHRKP